MKRSKQLMAGNIGNLFVLGLLLGLVNAGITFGAGLIPQPHVRVLVISVVAAVLTIFASAAFVAFYFSCRCKHEQFDLSLLAESVAPKHPAISTAVLLHHSGDRAGTIRWARCQPLRRCPIQK